MSESFFSKEVFCIDAGCDESGFIHIKYFPKSDWQFEIVEFGIMENEELNIKLMEMDSQSGIEVVIEMITSYGMPVGKTTFNTVFWIGRFYESSLSNVSLLARSKVKQFLCGKMVGVKDKNVTAAVKNYFPANGGGKDKHKGTKNDKGSLYGITSHVWAALGLGIAYCKGAKLYNYKLN